MTATATEFQAKVDKTATNMDRFDSIVNGGPTQDVTTDSGSVPTYAKLAASFAGISVAASRQSIHLDGTGAVSPSSQTNTFTAVLHNVAGSVTWSVTDLSGAAKTPTTTYLSAATGASVSMTVAQFNSAAGTSGGIIVTATAGIYTDSVTIVSVKDGATGSTGANGSPGYKSFSTYSALAATTDTVNTAAKVEGPDTGTHTDPVTGTTGVPNVGRYAYSTSPAGWTRLGALTSLEQTYFVANVPPSTIDTGTSQTLMEMTAPDRTDVDGTHSNIPISIKYSYNPYAANEVGSGSPKHTNVVLTIGENVSGSQTPVISGQPSFYDAWERKFAIPSAAPGTPWIYQCERHIGQVNLTGGGGVRPWTMGVPWDPTYYAYDLTQTRRIALDTVVAGNGADIVYQLVARGPSPCSPTMNLFNRFAFVHNGNNLAWMRQLNAAGNAALNLPYLNNRDNLVMQQSIEQDIQTWATNSVGVYSAHAIISQNTPDSARLRYLSFNGTSLTVITDVETQGPASNVLQWNLQNTHASGAARQVIQSNGSQEVQFMHSASGVMATLKAANSCKRIEVDKPFRLPTYNSGTIPTAADAGAGGRAFVSDANSATFNAAYAGGGSNFVPVFSDGSTWKIG